MGDEAVQAQQNAFPVHHLKNISKLSNLATCSSRDRKYYLHPFLHTLLDESLYIWISECGYHIIETSELHIKEKAGRVMLEVNKSLPEDQVQ